MPDDDLEGSTAVPDDDLEIEIESSFPGDAEGISEGDLIGRLVVFFKKGSVRQRVLAPMGFDGGIMVTNLFTGIIVARTVGASGRGELAATLLIAQLAAWLFSVGAAEAIAYHQAHSPEDARRLLSSWLILMVPLTVIGVAISELLLPVIFAAQSGEAIDIARVYLLVIPMIGFQQIFTALLLGDHDFFHYNVTRAIYPVATLAIYVVWVVVGDFSVKAALVANAAAMVVGLSFSIHRCLVRHGLGSPDWPLLRSTLTYGLRAHGGAAAGIINARLDLLIMPAYLAATGVGLYSIATNVTSTITALTGTVALMALPISARQGRSPRPVVQTLHAALAISTLLAIPVLVLAPWLLGLVYGTEFEAAATATRLLVPAVIAATGAGVCGAGLLAAGRPLTASAAAGVGAAATIVGLLIFLPIGGITAAAIVSSTVYVGEFFLMAELYRRAAKLSWGDFLHPGRL